jgi:hypothetical protein
MTTTQFNTLNSEGIDFNATYTPYIQTAAVSSTNSPDNPGPPFLQGTYARGSGESEYVFVYASGAVALGDVVQLSPTYTAVSVTTTLATFGSQLGVAQVAIAASAYGWVQRAGYCQKIGTAAAAVVNVQLATTATAGQIDDSTATGTKNINGMVLATTAGSQTVVTGILNYPTVGTTN